DITLWIDEVHGDTNGDNIQNNGEVWTYIQTTGNHEEVVLSSNLAAGSTVTIDPIGNFNPFDISGRKFTDITGNGITADDTGLGGVTIFIDFNGDGLNNDGAANQTVTAANGTWSFTNLDATYAGKHVYEVLPSGYVQTVGAAGYTIVGTSGHDQTN